MAFAEDLALFFDTDEFAVTAFLDGAEDQSFPVIFDREHIEALGLAGGASATRPLALARSSDVAGFHVAPGSVLRIPIAAQGSWGSQQFWGGGPFNVLDLQPDGTGLTLIVLEVA